jgi:hypothetical protein
MKITNFRNLIVKDGIATAQVDVTTGSWFWEKTETKVVVNQNVVNGVLFNVGWTWVDTGRFTSGFQVEELYTAYKTTAAAAGRYT